MDEEEEEKIPIEKLQRDIYRYMEPNIKWEYKGEMKTSKTENQNFQPHLVGREITELSQGIMLQQEEKQSKLHKIQFNPQENQFYSQKIHSESKINQSLPQEIKPQSQKNTI